MVMSRYGWESQPTEKAHSDAINQKEKKMAFDPASHCAQHATLFYGTSNAL